MSEKICRHVVLSMCLSVAAAHLGGCGINPLVPWEVKPEPDGQLDTMPVARAQADSLKNAIQAKADTFVGTKVLLNDSLLGLGVLTLGLAVSNAHRDAYLITAGLAGSAYLFGTTSLQDATLQAYQSGIGAVNCAVAAVRPMQVTQTSMTGATTAASDMRPKIVTLASAIVAAENELARSVGLAPESTTAARQQIETARIVYAKAAAANADAATLEATVTKAAGALKGTLVEIHRQVNSIVSKSVVDPSAIPKALESLVSIVGSFGKGLGIDAFLGARLDAANLTPKPDTTAGTAQGAGVTRAAATPPSAELVAALNALGTARADVTVLADPLAAQLERYKSFDESAELAKCGVSAAASAMTVDRDILTFAGKAEDDQSKSITVGGGIKPYTARFRDSPTRGVEVVNPMPGDRTIIVRVPKGTAGEFELGLMVTDGASTPQVKLVSVRVGADSAGGKPPPPTDIGRAIAALKQAVDRKEVMLMDKSGKGNGYTVTKVVEEGGNAKVTLSCTQGTAKGSDARSAVLLTLVTWLNDKFKPSPPLPADLTAKIILDGGTPCLKG